MSPSLLSPCPLERFTGDPRGTGARKTFIGRVPDRGVDINISVLPVRRRDSERRPGYARLGRPRGPRRVIYESRTPVNGQGRRLGGGDGTTGGGPIIKFNGLALPARPRAFSINYRRCNNNNRIPRRFPGAVRTHQTSVIIWTHTRSCAHRIVSYCIAEIAGERRLLHVTRLYTKQ